MRPWNADHAAERITRPVRHNGQPYTGINILSLWGSASVYGFAAPIWMTYRQASALGAQVRKGEKGSPVVYANTVTERAGAPSCRAPPRAVFPASEPLAASRRTWRPPSHALTDWPGRGVTSRCRRPHHDLVTHPQTADATMQTEAIGRIRPA